MAAKYRKIDPRIWGDEKFVKLNERGKLIAFNAITAQSNRCGLFRYSIPLAAEQTAIETDSYAKAFVDVCHRLRWRYDHEVRVLYIPTWWKYNAPENSKHLTGCLSDLQEVPQTILFNEFANNVQYVPDHCREVFRIHIELAKPIPIPISGAGAGAGAGAEAGIKPAGAGSPPARDSGKPAKDPESKKDRKPPTGNHHELIRFFCDGWKTLYAKDYVFGEGKDGRHIQWILSAVVHDMDEAKLIVKTYLADDELWITAQCHPLGILVSHFNKYRVMAHAPARTQRRSNGKSHRTEFTGARRSLPTVNIADSPGQAVGGGGKQSD